MMMGDRSRQIIGWLRTRLTPAEAEAHVAEMDRSLMEAVGEDGGWLRQFREDLLERAEPGDEFWLYDSGTESWINMHGERGVALVRGGRVVDIFLECRN